MHELGHRLPEPDELRDWLAAASKGRDSHVRETMRVRLVAVDELTVRLELNSRPQDDTPSSSILCALEPPLSIQLEAKNAYELRILLDRGPIDAWLDTTMARRNQAIEIEFTAQIVESSNVLVGMAKLRVSFTMGPGWKLTRSVTYKRTFERA